MRDREVRVCPPWCGRKHGHVWTQGLADRLNAEGPPPPPPGLRVAPPRRMSLLDRLRRRIRTARRRKA